MTAEPNPADLLKEIDALLREVGQGPAAAPPDADNEPTFPTWIFPAPIRAHVEGSARAVETPASMVALPLLVAAAAAIGNTRRLIVRKGFVVAPILWGCVVGRPGTGKTPAFDAGAAPLKALQADAWSAFKDALAKHDDELAEWKAAKDGSPKPRPPVLEHYFTTDPTKEALAPICEASAGVAILRDEIGAWVAGFDAYRRGGGDRQDMLSLWSGSALKVDRKGAAPLYVAHPAVSVVGGTQPDLLPQMAHELGADGFLDRFLWDFPTVPARTWGDDLGFDTEPTEAVVNIFRKLRNPEAHEHDEGTARLHPEAKARFLAWARENDAEAERLYGAGATGLAGAYVKLPLQLARLALVLHCLHETADPSRMVAPATMTAAVEAVEYFRAQAQRVFARFGATAAPRYVGLPARVLDALGRADGEPVTRTQLHALLGRNVKAADLDVALAALAADGRIERGKAASATKPAETWRLAAARADPAERMNDDEGSPTTSDPAEMLHEDSFVRDAPSTTNGHSVAAPDAALEEFWV